MSDETEPSMEKIRAADVGSFRWGLWCSIADGKPFTNPIVSARWSEDGESIWFMLDSHNFYNAKPDDVLELVRLGDFYAGYKTRTAGPKPTPIPKCPSCGQAVGP